MKKNIIYSLIGIVGLVCTLRAVFMPWSELDLFTRIFTIVYLGGTISLLAVGLTLGFVLSKSKTAQAWLQRRLEKKIGILM